MSVRKIYLHEESDKATGISPIPAPRNVYASLSFNSVDIQTATELYEYAISLGAPFSLYVDDEIPNEELED